MARRVFVSHTAELREFPAGRSYIAEVERAVNATGNVVVDMADFPAADLTPAELCVARLLECDVYVGVLGARYGSAVRDRPEVSYTELEFDTATEAGLTRLVFLLDVDSPTAGLPPEALVDPRYGGRQDEFRKRVLAGGLTAQSFHSPDHLARLVERSLRELDDQAPRIDNLPVATRVFEGRDLSALAGLLQGDGGGAVVGQAAVHGLGGIGKSELANHYARSCRDTYRVIWWITADTAENVSLGLARLAGRLRPPGTLADAQDWALTWLQNHRDWLLILDNVEDIAVVEPLLGQIADRGRVLITTRWNFGAARWARLGLAPLELGVLDRAASVRLLTRLTGLSDEEGADRLAAELDGLPLALDQAAAYLGQNDGLTFDGYRELLAGHFDRLAGDAGAGGRRERTVAEVWRVGLDAAEQRSPLAGRVLRVMAWLAPDELPEDVLRPLSVDDLDLRDALAVLAAYSLISRADGRLSVHRLVQAVTRADLRPAGAGAREQAVGLLREAIPANPMKNVAGWPRWNALLPHIDAVLEHFGPGHTNLDLLHVGDRAAKYRQNQGQLLAAVAGFEQAAAGRDRVLGPAHPDTLQSRHNLAYAYQAAGRTADAIALHEQVLAGRLEALGADHPDTLASRHNLAYALRTAGQVTAAIDRYVPTLADRERVLGHDHPDTLMTRNNLGFAYRSAGRLPEAIALAEASAAARERVLGPDHPDTLTGRGNLAGIYRQAGRLTDAIDLLEGIAADRERLFGPRHPQTLTARNSLVGAIREAGRTDEAIARYDEIIAATREALGEDHPNTLTARNDLAYALRVAGRVDEAIAVHEQVLAARRRVLGEDHPSTLTSRHNLATTYRVAGRLTEAIAEQTRVIADRRRILGAEHPSTLKTRHNLAAAYLAADRVDEAIALHEAVLDDRRRILGDDHPSTLTSRHSLADARLAGGHTAEAVRGYERALADRRRVLGEAHPATRKSAAALRAAR